MRKRLLIATGLIVALAVPAVAFGANVNFTGTFANDSNATIGFHVKRVNGKNKEVLDLSVGHFNVNCTKTGNTESGPRSRSPSMPRSSSGSGTSTTGPPASRASSGRATRTRPTAPWRSRSPELISGTARDPRTATEAPGPSTPTPNRATDLRPADRPGDRPGRSAGRSCTSPQGCRSLGAPRPSWTLKQ